MVTNFNKTPNTKFDKTVLGITELLHIAQWQTDGQNQMNTIFCNVSLRTHHWNTQNMGTVRGKVCQALFMLGVWKTAMRFLWSNLISYYIVHR